MGRWISKIKKMELASNLSAYYVICFSLLFFNHWRV